MNRRGFLSGLGGAAVAGPAAAKAGLESLDLGRVATTGAGGSWYPGSVGSVARSGADADHAQRQLSKLMGKSASAIERERKTYHVSGLDPDVATLRSVSLGRKIEMSRHRQYDRDQRDRQGYFEGIIAGLWE